MSYIKHDTTIATVYDGGRDPELHRRVAALKASLPSELEPLVVGPVEAPVNGYVTYAFLPDGSGEGYPTSDEGDRARQAFADLFAGRNGVVHVRFGGDDDIAHAEAVDPLEHLDS